jgi:hypothetical protein
MEGLTMLAVERKFMVATFGSHFARAQSNRSSNAKTAAILLVAFDVKDELLQLSVSASPEPSMAWQLPSTDMQMALETRSPSFAEPTSVTARGRPVDCPLMWLFSYGDTK